MLILGNTAKLYCLNWLAERIEASTEFSILDLGCGTGLPFKALLERYPHVRYVGIEPSRKDAEIARRTLPGATIVNALAYDAHARLQEQFDSVVSFSAFEHVYRRERYLRSAKDCLKPDGHFLINYDSGHFVRIKAGVPARANSLRHYLLARLGQEHRYEAFVSEAVFRNLASKAGLTICAANSFNTWLKSIYRFVPDAHKEAFMHRWLELELWLNEIGTPYTDAQAAWWLTRNFILRHDTRSSPQSVAVSALSA